MGTATVKTVDRFLNRSGYLCWPGEKFHMKFQGSWGKYYSNTFQWETNLQPISYSRLTLDGILLSSTSLANIKSAYANLKHNRNTHASWLIIHNVSYNSLTSLLVSCLASWVGCHVYKLLQRLLFHLVNDSVILILKHPQALNSWHWSCSKLCHDY